MAKLKNPLYAVCVSQEFKARMNKLPKEVHKALGPPMRKHLEKLVAQAEKNG